MSSVKKCNITVKNIRNCMNVILNSKKKKTLKKYYSKC